MQDSSPTPRQVGGFGTLRLEVQDGIALVTIDRPEARNALSLELQRELRDALAALRTDAEVGAVVFTGSGDRAFAAGADINGLRDYSYATAITSGLQRLFDEIEAFEKPTIAAINGLALGGGCELAMACDLRIASATARLGLPETSLGIIPGAGGTQRLTRLTGVGMALDLILTGRLLSAEEAREAGLVSRVVAADGLLDTCREVAAAVLARGPLAVRLARMVVRAGADVDQASGQLIERLAQAVLYETDDKREGVTAFFDKRPARFNGK